MKTDEAQPITAIGNSNNSRKTARFIWWGAIAIPIALILIEHINTARSFQNRFGGDVSSQYWRAAFNPTPIIFLLILGLCGHLLLVPKQNKLQSILRTPVGEIQDVSARMSNVVVQREAERFAIGPFILSVIIPLYGFVLAIWLQGKGEPGKVKSALIGAIISVVLVPVIALIASQA